MIRSRNKRGFTLLEVLFALVVFSIVVTPLFILYGSLFRSVVNVSDHVQRIFFAKQIMWQARREQPLDSSDFSLKERETELPTSLHYQLTSLEKDTHFKELPGLCREQVTIAWDEGSDKKTDHLVTYVFKSALLQEKKS